MLHHLLVLATVTNSELLVSPSQSRGSCCETSPPLGQCRQRRSCPPPVFEGPRRSSCSNQVPDFVVGLQTCPSRVWLSSAARLVTLRRTWVGREGQRHSKAPPPSQGPPLSRCGADRPRCRCSLSLSLPATFRRTAAWPGVCPPRRFLANRMACRRKISP